MTKQGTCLGQARMAEKLSVRQGDRHLVVGRVGARRERHGDLLELDLERHEVLERILGLDHHHGAQITGRLDERALDELLGVRHDGLGERRKVRDALGSQHDLERVEHCLKLAIELGPLWRRAHEALHVEERLLLVSQRYLGRMQGLGKRRDDCGGGGGGGGDWGPT